MLAYGILEKIGTPISEEFCYQKQNNLEVTPTHHNKYTTPTHRNKYTTLVIPTHHNGYTT